MITNLKNAKIGAEEGDLYNF